MQLRIVAALLFFSSWALGTTYTCCGAHHPLTVPQNTQLLMYGDGWSSEPIVQAVVTNFLNGFQFSEVSAIQSYYYGRADLGALPVSRGLSLTNVVSVPTNAAYGSSSTITYAHIQNLIADTIAGGGITAPLADYSNTYIVMAAPGMLITGSQFPGGTCAQHDTSSVSGFFISYITVQDQTQEPGCSVGSTVSGDAVSTQASNALYHELIESYTFGWGEIADPCDFTYGATQTYLGQAFNHIIGTIHYLLQRIWNQYPFPDPSAGSCQQVPVNVPAKPTFIPIASAARRRQS